MYLAVEPLACTPLVVICLRHFVVCAQTSAQHVSRRIASPRIYSTILTPCNQELRRVRAGRLLLLSGHTGSSGLLIPALPNAQAWHPS